MATAVYTKTVDSSPAACMLTSKFVLTYTCGVNSTALDEYSRWFLFSKMKLDGKAALFSLSGMKSEYGAIDLFRDVTAKAASNKIMSVIRPDIIMADGDTDAVEMEVRQVTDFGITTTTALGALPASSPVTPGVSLTVSDSRNIRVGSWIIIRSGVLSEMVYVESNDKGTNILTVTRNPFAGTLAIAAMPVGANVEISVKSAPLRGQCNVAGDCETYSVENCCIVKKISKIADCMTFPAYIRNQSKQISGTEKISDKIVRDEFRRMFKVLNSAILGSEYGTQVIGGNEVTTFHGWDQYSQEYSVATITNACCTAEWVELLNNVVKKAGETEMILDSDNKNVIIFASNNVMTGLNNIQDNRISIGKTHQKSLIH
jgi:hypothetical protein